MKLQSLNEGLIKLPDNVIKDAVSILCRFIFNKVVYHIKNSDYPDSEILEKRVRLLARNYQKKYAMFSVKNTSPPEVLRNTIYFDPQQLPRRYFYKGRYSKVLIPIDLYVAMTDYNGSASISPSGYYQKKKGNENATIWLFVTSEDNIKNISTDIQEFDSVLNRTIGVLEHEIMHAVQDLAFKIMPDGDHLDYWNGDEIDLDKYYSSDIEFAPLIISEVSHFISLLNEYDDELGGLNDSQINRFINSYVSGNGRGRLKSPFFARLQKSNQLKWKRAVKYFTTLFWEKYKKR